MVQVNTRIVWSFLLHMKSARTLTNHSCLIPHSSSGGGGYDAIIGRHKHNDRDGDEVSVAKEFIHPRYNDRTTNNDFMVLKLSRKTTAGTSVKINSSRSSPQDGQEVVVMGFGVTNENTQQTSNKLMEVTVDVVSDADCRKAYGNEVTASTMICAASRSKDSCQGDSGGPVSCRKIARTIASLPYHHTHNQFLLRRSS